MWLCHTRDASARTVYSARAPSSATPNVQHIFSARLDLAVDDDEGGKGLVVSEVSAGKRKDGEDKGREAQGGF